MQKKDQFIEKNNLKSSQLLDHFLKCFLSLLQISFSALAIILSISSAVSVEYYPHNHHADTDHLKYVEPAHVKTIKYVQPAPILKHYAAPAQAPIHAHVKYINPEPQPHPIKYIDNHHRHHSHYSQHAHAASDYHDDYEPAHYEYGYDVQDHQTGDFKSHSEKRDGHRFVIIF